MTQFAISLGVFRVNRSCKPANPAFTMSEILRRARPRKVRAGCASKLFGFAVSNVAGFGLPSRSCACPNSPSSRDRASTRQSPLLRSEDWWSRSGSNRRPEACKATALPTELRPRFRVSDQMVGPERVERSTSRLSGVRSNHLSYEPDRCRL